MFEGSTYCNMPKQNIILGLKIKTVEYNKPNYLGHPTSCLYSHLEQLCSISYSWHRQTVPCGEMSQPHTIQILWCIPVTVDIAILEQKYETSYS